MKFRVGDWVRFGDGVSKSFVGIEGRVEKMMDIPDSYPEKIFFGEEYREQLLENYTKNQFDNWVKNGIAASNCYLTLICKDCRSEKCLTLRAEK